MKILLVGHSVFDIISLPGKEVSSPGGIFYSVQQLLKISFPDDKLFICTQIDDNSKEHFLPIYSEFNTEFIEKVDSIPSVKLMLDNNSERKEIYFNTPSKLNINKINFSDFDAILINMITGNDITAEDLKLIRSQTSGIIFFDIHTLSRPMNQSGERIFSQIKNYDIINETVAKKALEMIDVDSLGLEPADKHILRVIIEKFGGGPVGLGTIAAATSEEIKTIEDVYEPYLIQIGFLARTSRGRIVTEAAYKHLGIKYNNKLL